MKGTLMDLPVIMAILLGGSITIFLVYYVLTALSGAWPSIAGAESAYILSRGIESFSVFDYMFVVLAFGLGLFCVISGFFIDSHPVFMAFDLIFLLPIIIFTSAQITNVFDAIATAPELVSVSNNFPYIITFMRGLPLYCLIMGVLIAIAVHGKPGGGTI